MSDPGIRDESRLPVERILVGAARRTGRESIHVELWRMPDGRWRAALAPFYSRDPGGVEKPGRGVISLQISALPDLAHVIDAAVREARDRGLVE